MSRSFLLILVVIAATILIACCVAPVPSEKKPVAIISGHPNWPPVMSDNNGTPSGIGPETNRMVFKDIGMNVEFKSVGSWDVVQEKLKTGEIFGVVAIYKTKEREKYLYYSIPYTTDPIVLFINNKSKFIYNQKEDLVGKKGVATIGDSYGQIIDDYIVQANLSIVRVSSPEEAFSLLKDRKVDYFIYSAYAGRIVIAEKGLSGFKESKIVSDQLFYIGISKNSSYKVDMNKVNSSLQRLLNEEKIPK